MKHYLKSEFVGPRGELGTATRIPPKSDGGAVTAADIVTATGQMNAHQAADTLGNIGGEPQKMTVTFTESGGVISADKTISEIKAAYDAPLSYCLYDVDDMSDVMFESPRLSVAHTSTGSKGGTITEVS